MANLCTRNDVKYIAYGRILSIDITGSSIDRAIEDAQDEVYSRYGYTKRVKVAVVSTRTVYEFRPTRLETYSVDRVFINSPNINIDNEINRNLVSSSDYTSDLNANTLTISSGLAGSYNGSYMEVDFIPNEWHVLTKNKAALNLLDENVAAMNPGEGETDNPRVSRIAKRIARIEGDIKPAVAVGSFENIDYDIRDREKLTQVRFNKT